MPKVVSYNVPWLSRPSPGHGLFCRDINAENASPKRSALMSPRSGAEEYVYEGPHRLVAHRGTEVFTVVGKQIRWADLSHLKNTWEREPHGASRQGASQSLYGGQPPYRTLNVSIHQDIRQIITSPSGHFLALLTSHTVHIAILPDRLHLKDDDPSPLKLRTWQIGRTAHCLGEGRSPVITALWHPLALSSNHQDCLVTVTTDAIVRVWEFERYNTYSMDNPTLAVDLKKLADGQSCDDDYAPSAIGKVQAFSPDSFDMEVASASFGGQAYEDEEGWAPMTLWVAMRNGDVYALCPLLPTRWRPSASLIPSLSTSVVSKLALLQGSEIDSEQAKAIKQQFSWVKEIDEEDPTLGTPDSEDTPAFEIRKRPSNPSPIPRLQGPFIPSLSDEELEELDVTDIHVISARIDQSNSEIDDEDEGISIEGSSATTVCLATIAGRVLICLIMTGVEGQWLPKTKKTSFTVPNTEASELLVLDTIDAPRGVQDVPDQWPTFTEDVLSSYGFFLTTASTVQFYSLAEWIPRLESELSSTSSATADDNGLAFRMKVLCESDITLHEEILHIDQTDTGASSGHLSASLLLESYDFGYFLLTATASQPYTVIFDDASVGDMIDANYLAHPSAEQASPEELPVRAPYTPSNALYNPPGGALLQNLTAQVPSRHRSTLKSEVRMSAATLDIMANAHRTLSGQTVTLERSAAELFRRVERLRNEVRDAVEQMVTLAERLQDLQENIEDNEKGSFDERFENISTKQTELVSRYEGLKSKVARVGDPGNRGKELNAKEVAWMEEIQKISSSVGLQPDDAGGKVLDDEAAALRSRYDQIKNLTASLLSQVRSLPPPPSSATASRPTTPADPSLPISKPNDTPAEKSLKESELKLSSRAASPAPSLRDQSLVLGGSAGGSVSSKLQRRKIEEAMAMVEREGAVIDAAMRRLKALGLSEA